MTRFTRNILRVVLLLSWCRSALLGACKCKTTVGFLPDGAFHVREVNIDEEGSEYDGSSYYETYKKEHLYDFSLFTFDGAKKTVTVCKSYDETQVIKGSFEYTAGENVTSMFDESYREYTSSKLKVTLENGDVFEGSTQYEGMWKSESHIYLTGNGIAIRLEEGKDEEPYFAEYHETTPQKMGNILFGESENAEILGYMDAYEDNRYPQTFRTLYQSFVDRERLLIYPDFVYSNSVYNVVLYSKGELGLPSFRFRFDDSKDYNLDYYVHVTYLLQEYGEDAFDGLEKYKDGGQVWNEARTKVGFLYEYKHPNLAYSEKLWIEIERFSNEPITENLVNGLKFATIAGKNDVEDCLTDEEISALDIRYEELCQTDNLYKGEKIDGYEILDDFIYMKPMDFDGKALHIYRLLADDSVIAEVIVFERGLFYHEGVFYTFDGYRELSILYLYFCAD